MLEGVFTALVTPFDKNLKIDREGLKKIVDFQIKEGISGLVPMGTTGESPTVTIEENMDVVEMVVKLADGKVPVIAGTGSNCTEEAIKMTKMAKNMGADYSLQVNPYYNKPTQEGLYRHFMTIADNVDLPMVLYNISSRTGVNLETETLLRLTKHENIVAVKEASGNLGQMMDVINGKPKDFSVLSGDDNIALPVTLMGGNGVISVASNIVPRWMEEMIGSARKGHVEKAKAIHYDLLPLFKAMFLETNPIPVKSCMSMMGLLEEEFRLPLCPPSDENRKALKEMMRGQGLI
ncbi:MAG: 4-hydroxy-tetrahydrodipicolinate synthase [Spirochaetales bacterium]|nr:4-hydroxy-tetrahydrodipicolinate synthase [Spirochaetales bacterium]